MDAKEFFSCFIQEVVKNVQNNFAKEEQNLAGVVEQYGSVRAVGDGASQG